ncbi:hypothetical protein H2204_009585 [Knufia peltigerae]|uniref:BTB domain-containing protein n=1 Tax=Knufia peltigerae TaxID=1002370 RepID=A0AA38XXS4_9EURO|nr:hypothetical protein H2204_009585 [Knufia peltigerae]
MAEPKAISNKIRNFNFLKDEEFCDFTICCQGVAFRVHRLFIAQASPYFKTVCTGPFQEAMAQKIDFPEEIPSVMSRVIYYIYTSKYDPMYVPHIYTLRCLDPPELQIDDLDIRLDDDILMTTAPPQDTAAGVGAGTGADATSSTARVTIHSSNKIEEKLYIKQLGRAMKVGIMVYKFADMAQMEHLKHLAASRFLDDLKKAYRVDDFHSVVSMLYENTNYNDKVIRMPATQFLLSKYDDINNHRETTRVMDDHNAGMRQMFHDFRGEWEKEFGQWAAGLVSGLNGNELLRCKHQKKVTFVLPTSTDKPGQITYGYSCPLCR